MAPFFLFLEDIKLNFVLYIFQNLKHWRGFKDVSKAQNIKEINQINQITFVESCYRHLHRKEIKKKKNHS